MAVHPHAKHTGRFTQAQLHNETHLIDYWYGVTWNVNRRMLFKWKHTSDESYRDAVQAFFEPRDFLRTLGLGDDECIAGFIHIGTPQLQAPERDRPDPAELLTDLQL